MTTEFEKDKRNKLVFNNKSRPASNRIRKIRQNNRKTVKQTIVQSVQSDDLYNDKLYC